MFYYQDWVGSNLIYIRLLLYRKLCCIGTIVQILRLFQLVKSHKTIEFFFVCGNHSED